MSGEKLTRRTGSIDFLKAFAIVGVLILHASTDGYYTPMGGFDWYASLLWGSIVRASVPIFLMTSGALMLDPEREFSLKKLWTKSLPRLVAAMLFWAFCYYLYRMVFINHDLSPATLVENIKHILLLHHEFHLYYMHIILVVYALLPVTRLITAHADKRTMEYLLVLWFVLGIFLPTFIKVWPFNLLYGMPAKYPLNFVYCSVGYGLFGWYLRKYARNWKKWLAFAVAGLAMVYGGTVVPSLKAGTLVTGALEGASPGVMVLAAGICGAAFAGLREWEAPKWCSLLSRASFCIYLVHVFFLYILKSLGLHATAGPCVLMIPLTAAAMLACSLVVWLICSRIPVVRKWLI